MNQQHPETSPYLFIYFSASVNQSGVRQNMIQTRRVNALPEKKHGEFPFYRFIWSIHDLYSSFRSHVLCQIIMCHKNIFCKVLLFSDLGANLAIGSAHSVPNVWCRSEAIFSQVTAVKKEFVLSGYNLIKELFWYYDKVKKSCWWKMDIQYAPYINEPKSLFFAVI